MYLDLLMHISYENRGYCSGMFPPYNMSHVMRKPVDAICE